MVRWHRAGHPLSLMHGPDYILAARLTMVVSLVIGAPVQACGRTHVRAGQTVGSRGRIGTHRASPASCAAGPATARMASTGGQSPVRRQSIGRAASSSCRPGRAPARRAQPIGTGPGQTSPCMGPGSGPTGQDRAPNGRPSAQSGRPLTRNGMHGPGVVGGFTGQDSGGARGRDHHRAPLSPPSPSPL